MTGATGDLTPDEVQRDFEPGEWREAGGTDQQGDVTRSQASHAPAHHGPPGAPGEPSGGVGPTELAGRESGFDSDEGLSPDDPAYRMEERPESSRIGERRKRDSRMGGDELQDHEEHL